MSVEEIRERINRLDQDIRYLETHSGFRFGGISRAAELVCKKAERDHLSLNELPKYLAQIQRVAIGIPVSLAVYEERDFERRMNEEHKSRLQEEYNQRMRSRKMFEIEFEEESHNIVFDQVHPGQFFLDDEDELCIKHDEGGYVKIAYEDGTPSGYLAQNIDKDWEIKKILPMFKKFKINH